MPHESEVTPPGRVGRSGKAISIPIGFVRDSEKLYFLPVTGSDTQWYKNAFQNPGIRIDARGTEAEFQAVLIAERKIVPSVIERFREKYAVGDVKKYTQNWMWPLWLS